MWSGPSHPAKHRVETFCPDAASTLDLGRRLGSALRPGAVVALYGELGAGKTTLAKGIAESLGIPASEITSASFTIIAEHYGRVPLYHVDLYRLSSEAVGGVGLEEYFDTEGVVVIEWPERYEDYLPDDRINVVIRMVPDGRVIEVSSLRELTLS